MMPKDISCQISHHHEKPSQFQELPSDDAFDSDAIGESEDSDDDECPGE